MFYYLKTELIKVGKVPSKAPGTQEEINKCQVPFVPSCGVTCHLGWHNLIHKAILRFTELHRENHDFSMSCPLTKSESH